MDIRSGAAYPAGRLSNFAPNRFVLDGIDCASMEGFLQSLKVASGNTDMQRHIASLVGAAAKSAGAKRNWQRTGTLHWNGREIDRFGPEYQALLDRAFEAMAVQCESFRKALLATGDGALSHSMGKRKEGDTVLTQTEFTSRLIRLRAALRTGKLLPGSAAKPDGADTTPGGGRSGRSAARPSREPA